MIHSLYRVLNISLLAVLGIFLCSLQSVFLKAPTLSWLELDLVLLVVVYLSLHRHLMEGTIVVLILSRLLEIHSGAPVGVLTVCYLAVFLALLFTKEMFLVGTSFSAILLSMGGGAIWKISFLLVGLQMGYFSNVWAASLQFLIPYLLGLAVFSRPIFSLLQWIDGITHYDIAAEDRQLSGEDMGL